MPSSWLVTSSVIRSASRSGQITIGCLRLQATGAFAGPDGNGLARWDLDGIIEDGSTTIQPISGGLRYHGVYRRGTDAWAWLNGSLTTTTRGRPSRLDIVFDLITVPKNTPWRRRP